MVAVALDVVQLAVVAAVFVADGNIAGGPSVAEPVVGLSVVLPAAAAAVVEPSVVLPVVELSVVLAVVLAVVPAAAELFVVAEHVVEPLAAVKPGLLPAVGLVDGVHHVVVAVVVAGDEAGPV